MNRSLFAAGALAWLTLSLACSSEKPASAAQPHQRREGDVAPRASVVAAPAQPYRPVAVPVPGKITGSVQFDGAFPADTVIQLATDQTGCGASVVDRRVERNGNRVAGAVVWLTDIRQGKPLPLERRFELENEDCVMIPRVQAVMTGGTLNVISADVAMHNNRIINVGTGEVEAMAPFNDNGQVVPFDKLLTKPAELEVTCELHPWTRAYLVVLDHPYYAITGKAGDFSIDGIPAGTYHLRAWHPVLGFVDQTVTVAGGGTISAAVKLPGVSAAPIAPVTDSTR